MKKIIKIILFSVVLTAVFIGSYQILSWKDTSGDYQSTTNRLYESENNTIDAVFLGSSHVYCSVMPYILWENYGMSAFDMSISGQDRESTYYHIKEVLKTQNPKVICVDMGGIVYDGYGIEGNLYRNMLSMKLSKNNIDLINASVPEEERFNFITRWPIIHTRYAELQKYDFKTFDFSVFGRGEVVPLEVNPQVKDMEIIGYEGIGEIPEDKKEWIDRLIQLSVEEDFELVFFNAPFRMDINQKGIYNAIGVYLEEKGIPFFDFNQEDTLPTIDYATDFVDHAHLNIYGAEKLTTFLGEFLVNNYEFEDHRGDENYIFWDLDAAYCHHFIQAPKIDKETDWNTYVNYILNAEDMVVVISLDGDYDSSTLDLYSMLIPFEIEGRYHSGGKWIFENGDILTYIPGEDLEPFVKDLGEDILTVQNIIVQNDPSEMFSNIMINNKEVGITYQGLTIMVYDKILHKVIDIRSWY